MLPRNEVFTLKKAFTANASATELVRQSDGKHFGGAAIEAGGFIDLGAVTSATVTITDANGLPLYTGTALAVDTVIPPVPQGVSLPLYAAITSFTGAGTLTVYWSVKK